MIKYEWANLSVLGQFFRFVMTGVLATLGNMATVWASRHVMAYPVALITGMLTGCIISFLMSKFFVFRSTDLAKAQGESARFLIVYVSGLAVYYVVSLVFGTQILPRFLPVHIAELGGVVAGGGVMAFTSYFGHRFYTYAHMSNP